MNQFTLLKNSIKQLIKRQHSTSVLFIRHGQTNQNLSNTLQGWTDSRLNIRGREQANDLMQSIFPFRDQFTQIFSSDLQRAKETAEISLGFPPEQQIIEDSRLRELYFGKHENLAYSMLDQETKDIIFTMNYQAPGGESWVQARDRAMKCITERVTKNGTYIAYSHGGVICTITYDLGLQESLSNCGCVALDYDLKNKKFKEILFKWEFPNEEEKEI